MSHPSEQYPKVKAERDRIRDELDKRKLARGLIKLAKTAKQRSVRDFDDLQTNRRLT